MLRKILSTATPLSVSKWIVVNIFASILWSIALIMVIVPNEIASGGSTGITLIVNHFTGISIGTLSLLVNLPLLLCAWFTLGRGFVFRTMMSVLTFTLIYDFFMPLLYIPEYTNDHLLAAIMAGVLNGIGSGLVFMQGSSGGGADLIIKIVKQRWPHLSIGQIVLSINSVIMAILAMVFGNFEAMLYGLVMSFTSGQVCDLILNGLASANSIMIITTKPAEVSSHIITELHRSATILKGEGAYAHSEVSVMMCVVRKSELHKLNEMVRTIDENAFIVVQEALQVVGRTFVKKTQETT